MSLLQCFTQTVMKTDVEESFFPLDGNVGSGLGG